MVRALMAGKADLAYFDAMFARSADPWETEQSRFEWQKRKCIVSCLGNFRNARLLELGCGNGSNTRALARHALSVHACDGAPFAVERARAAVGHAGGVKVCHLPLPGRFPADRYDTIVIAELLYYLSNAALAKVMREIDRTLRPGGKLLLCHHHRQFHDATQRQSELHNRFVVQSHHRWYLHRHVRTGRWETHIFGRSKR